MANDLKKQEHKIRQLEERLRILYSKRVTVANAHTQRQQVNEIRTQLEMERLYLSKMKGSTNDGQ
jgi:DNA-binding transcriptional regulator YiaG